MKTLAEWRGLIYLILAILALVFLALYIKRFAQQHQDTDVPVVAQTTPALAKAPTEHIQSAPVIVYRQKAKDRLSLPQQVRQDQGKRVVSSSTVKSDIRPHEITTVLDVNTGQTVTYDTRKPLPWMGIDTHGEAGLFYGFRDGHKAIRIQAQQSLLDIKALQVKAIASADQCSGCVPNVSTFIGFGVAARW